MWSIRRFNRITPSWFLLIAVFVSVTCNDVKVSISPELPIINQPAGKPFVATCKGEAEDPNLFNDMKWMGQHGEITDDVSQPVYVLKQDPGSLFLTFNDPTREMSGTYNCTALYDHSITRSDSVQIVFYYAITFEDCPEVQALVIGTPGKIRCRANANPNAQVTWTKDRHQLEKNRYQIENDGISVTDVRETDAGKFEMRALVQQTGELQMKNIVVEVHVPPTITELKDREEVVEGERGELTCRASGTPPPQYNWFDPLQRNLSSVDGYIVDRNTGTLTIREVRKEDSGMYKCQAVNSAAKDEKTLDLTVLVRPEIRQFNNVTQVQEKDTTMECRSVGDPQPDLSIRKDGSERPLASGDDRIRIKKTKDGEEYVLVMTIQNTRRTDDGLYYCAADNKAGLAERVGHLTVEFAPDMTSTPARERKTWNDRPVNLTCVAEAIPNATITWYFRNRELSNDETYRIYGTSSYSSLLVRPNPGQPHLGHGDVYGHYRCEGRNQFGNSSIDINLQEAKVPGRIQQILLDKQTATTITFHIRDLIDDGGLPVTSYLVKYHEVNMPRDETKTYEWPEGTSYILEKLKPRTKYSFRFAAKNDAGVGEFGEPTDFVMPAESSPEMPVILMPGGNISRYHDHFTIRWVVPQDNGKPIQKFVLRYFQAHLVGNEWRAIGSDSTINIDDWLSNGPRCKMTGLNPNSYYKVELRAYNEIGFSQPASTVFQTAADPSKGLQGLPTLPGLNVEEQQRLEGGGGILTTPAIVAIVIVVVLVVLGLLDVTCYMRNQCGFFYCLRTTVCGRSSSSDKAKDKAMEDGKGGAKAANNGLAANESYDADRPDIDTSKSVDDGSNKTTEVDNPAFDDRLRQRNEAVQLQGEDAPMIRTVGAKDTKAANNDDSKNKSPKGSKSSIAKDSLV